MEKDGQGEPSPAVLVIHNASFDMKFLNFELGLLGHAPIGQERVIDSAGARPPALPGCAPANLDALCRRYDVDTSARTKHGALLDSELLAEVYLGLIGGRQPGFDLAIDRGSKRIGEKRERIQREPRPHAPTAAELEAHQAFLKTIKDPVWSR